MRPDNELLHTYAESSADEAFSELVHRHIGLVFNTALRVLGGDRHLAADATQEVFATLARKSRTLVGHPSLSGWLYTTASYTAAKVVRKEQRRKRREHDSFVMNNVGPVQGEPGEPTDLSLHLDKSMSALAETDRHALVSRFFENRSFAEVGAALRISEDAARKRVDRALEKLRRHLARSGVAITAGVLGAAMQQSSRASAPGPLAGEVVRTVIAAGITPATTGSLTNFGMSNLLSFLTGAGVAALAVAFFLIDAQIEKTTTSLSKAQQALAKYAVPNPPPPAAATPFLATPASPASVSPQRHARLLLSLDAPYSSLFRRLRLSPDETNELKELLVRRELGFEEARNFARKEGLVVDLMTEAELWALRSFWVDEVDEAIDRLLGPERAEYWRIFERGIRFRNAVFADLARMTRYSTSPITDEQIDRLVDLAVRHQSPTGPHVEIADQVVDEASSVLDASQTEALRLMVSRQQAVPSIRAMNLTAALEGRLELTEQSARHYPASVPAK